MTVPSSVAKSGPYICNGVTDVFNYDFRIVDKSHLKVLLTDADGNESTLDLTTHYTVSDVGSDTGSINLTSAGVALAVTGTTLTILRNPPFTQETDLQNQGAYLAQTVEDRFDLLTMQIQTVKERSDRSIAIAASDEDTTLDDLTADLVKVAGIAADVSTVAARDTDIGTVADRDADIATVAARDADIGMVADRDADIGTVAGISANVTMVAGISNDVTTVAGMAGQIPDLADAVMKADTDASTFGFVAGKDDTPADPSKVLPTLERISTDFKALNVDGGFSFALSELPTVNIGGHFGGTWKTAQLFDAQISGASSVSGSYFNMAVVNEADGLSASGAVNSHGGVFIDIGKTDYLTSTEEGQVLGIYNNVYGGRLGDHGATIFSATKVFDGTYNGGLLGIEGSIVRKDESGTTTGYTQVYMGWSMSVTGTNFSPDGTLGFCVEPRVGDTFAAYAAVERNDLTGDPSFEHIFVAGANRDNSNIFYSVTGSAAAEGAGRTHAPVGSAAFPTYSFIGDPNTGVYSPAADQVGFSAGGAVRLWVSTSNIQSTLAPKFLNSAAIPANGNSGFGMFFSSTPSFGVLFGSGAPTCAAAKGSLYLRSDGSTTTDRAYINTDGSTAWTALTTTA